MRDLGRCCRRRRRRPPARSRRRSARPRPTAPTAWCASTCRPSSRPRESAAGRRPRPWPTYVPVRVVDSLSVTLGLGMIARRGGRGPAAGAIARRDRRPGRGHGPPHQGLRHPRHPREPQEGRPHRRRPGPARLDPVDQAGDRGGRRGGGARSQAADPVRPLQYLVDQVGGQPGVENLAVLHGDAPDVDTLLEPARAPLPPGPDRGRASSGRWSAPTPAPGPSGWRSRPPA